MVERAAIYARISSDRDGSQAGVNRQVEDCRALADRKGWPVAEVYVDDDVSAYTGRLRPEYERMLADIGDGFLDAVVVWHVDRLHRHPRELEAFLDLCDGVRLTELATVTGDIDLATHDGRLMARVLGAFARKESDDKSRRIRRKHEEIARQGRPSGGTRPFGFEPDQVTVRTAEAAVIRECAARVLAGESIRSVCVYLNDRQVWTAAGNPWHQTTLRRMLLSPRIAGLRQHRGEVIGEAGWPPIISPAESARLHALLTDPSRTTRQPRRYVLSGGLLRCGGCGTALMSRPREDGTRRYQCIKDPGRVGCGRRSIVADAVEQFVTAAVLERLDTPELAAALSGSSGSSDDGVQADLDAAEQRLDELADAYAAEQITLKEWLRARKAIERRIEQARKRLSRLSQTSALDGYVGHGDQLRQQWASLSLSRQQAIIKAVLDHVVVGPGAGRNRFDHTRLRPVWRV